MALSHGRTRTVSLSRRLRDARDESSWAMDSLPSSVSLHHTLYPPLQRDKCSSTILATHGLLGTGNNWKTVLVNKRIREHRNVVLIDLRNHGLSPHTTPTRIHVDEKEDKEEKEEDMPLLSMGADIIALAHSLKNTSDQSKPLIALGHSLGGKVMMAACLMRPQLFSALIVADIAPFDYGNSRAKKEGKAEWRGASHIVESLSKLELKQIIDRRQADELLKSSIPEKDTRSFVLANLIRAPGEKNGVQWRCNMKELERNLHNFARFQVGDVRPNETLPTLFLVGEKSGFVRKEQHDAIFKYFPLASIKVLEGAGHWLHAEKPKETVQAIADFLQHHGL